MVVLVLGLELIMKHIRIDDEDTLGSSVGSSYGITYEKNLWVHCWKVSGVKVQMRRWGGSICVP